MIQKERPFPSLPGFFTERRLTVIGRKIETVEIMEKAWGWAKRACQGSDIPMYN